MIINYLKLKDFGLYSGEQTFNLKPIKKRNIILIGGKNGHGKTTLFDAIKLCLYGDRTIDRINKKKIYEDYLKERIHNNPNSTNNPTEAFIEIEFEYSSLGKIEIYNLKRFWKNVNDEISEEFTVKKNNQILYELDPEQWQDFINDLIPPGILKLFFFDGEKIQDLAEKENDDKQLSDSFKSLLGMDLIEKLKSDLEIYSIKQLKDTGSDILNIEINKFKEEILKQEEEMDNLLQKKAKIRSSIDTVETDIQRIELKISKEGGTFAKKRDELIQNKSRIDTEISNLEEQIRIMCSELLPFIFSRKLNQKLKNTLINEKEHIENKITRDNLVKHLSKLKKDIEKDKDWKEYNLTSKELISLFEKFSNKLEYRFSDSNTRIVPFHNLSKEDSDKLISLIDIVELENSKKINLLSNKYESFVKNRHQIEREITYAPDEISIAPLLKEINELNQKLGSFTQELRNVDEEISNNNNLKEKSTRSLNKRIEDMNNKEGISKRMQLIKKVNKVLEDYYNHLKKKKIEEFSESFIESFNQIAQKKDILKSIEVNPINYEVSLYGKDGKKIPKKRLSAGEKQIYAISLLWSLTKISGRPLPFIIDTPLGRLDSSHRDNLVYNFFPIASHQLIILSTDTEIDVQYAQDLEPNIARKILLNYNNGKTIIKEGYFEEEK